MGSLYTFSLYLHSWNRWIILIAGLLSIALAIKGLRERTAYSGTNRNLSLLFISSLHLQLLLGLLLYFILSPFTLQAMDNFGAAMKDSTLRYWAVEHSLLNIIAVIIAQAGSILIKRTADSRVKHRKTLIWSGIALLIILLMIPVGILGPERPWFRF
ncbi:hypothetical protein [Lentimicrobium sp.]|mgnify:FL=1|jgi:hypothetical protein|uniref:hypothetical protein n=1 Tax=Lentimicrobium sp. TaxID=2034841 RepID=UPI0025DBAA45|nr:hypothetical protein [Lentimicrobium sp.]MCO5256672.1 hypothetical protein [Lentimicrobium sp.]MCO5264212.1 hypothetical protein [Lentimicrobium sp.]HOP14389.1 hypothetical protein [Lentimicrobium sp.]HPF64372.1 hypothetical protein [Lentimicrobium sp.]HPJ62225.1 hypothetical protein [Lentimicrobium sp.]